LKNKLKEKREKMGYTQEEMAEKLGVSTVAYHFYETGQRNIPKMTVNKIIDILKLEDEEIFLPCNYSLR
jgi:DNA-binding helix-turn-helix protein